MANETIFARSLLTMAMSVNFQSMSLTVSLVSFATLLFASVTPSLSPNLTEPIVCVKSKKVTPQPTQHYNTSKTKMEIVQDEPYPKIGLYESIQKHSTIKQSLLHYVGTRRVAHDEKYKNIYLRLEILMVLQVLFHCHLH